MPRPIGEILPPTEANLARAAQALLSGKVVGMPTETVYGLAGVALDPSALAKIFSVKERPTFDPLIVHVVPRSTQSALIELEQAGVIDLNSIAGQTRELSQKLIEKFWPGPLTLVLPKGPRIPDLVTSGLPNVAIRMPRHPVAQQLILKAGAPLAAPSANRFGRISPTCAQHVIDELGDRIELVIDGGPCEIGLESTIISVHEGCVTLLRPGGITREQIESITGKPLQGPSGSLQNPTAPGMLASHYAPRTPLKIIETALDSSEVQKLLPLGQSPIGVLAFSGEPGPLTQTLTQLWQRPVTLRVLSQSGDLAEAARDLFAHLRALDTAQVTLILAQSSHVQTGLGYAINDRLKRAGAEHI